MCAAEELYSKGIQALCKIVCASWRARPQEFATLLRSRNCQWLLDVACFHPCFYFYWHPTPTPTHILLLFLLLLLQSGLRRSSIHNSSKQQHYHHSSFKGVEAAEAYKKSTSTGILGCLQGFGWRCSLRHRKIEEF